MLKEKLFQFKDPINYKSFSRAMNINTGSTPYSSYENYYQESANDYQNYQEDYGEVNEGLNVDQTDEQTHNANVEYPDLTYPDDGTDQIYRRNVEYDQYKQNTYEQSPCVSCAQIPCRKYLLNNQDYYVNPTLSHSQSQAPRMRLAKARRNPRLVLYHSRHQHCHNSASSGHHQDLVPPVTEVKRQYESYDPISQNYPQYGDYTGPHQHQEPQVYVAGTYGEEGGQRTYEQHSKHFRMGHGGAKKYPVTLKMQRHYLKKSVPPQISKRPSALSLPVATQPEPSATVGRKIRQNNQQFRKQQIEEQFEPYCSLDENQNLEPIGTHQITSHGDVIGAANLPKVENVMEQMNNANFLDEKKLVAEPPGEVKKTVKEFAKYFKPKVPSSIKTKQDEVTKMASSLSMETAPQPAPAKKKISLEQLLSRLQKCETDTQEVNKVQKAETIFNYDTISRKISSNRKPIKSQENIARASTSLTTSLDRKKSLDDYGALELHKSKSYIVNLIDRALSKELGTIPRERLPDDEMSTKKALESISRHRGPLHKELCYEVTAALTDSFISNATAPPLKEVDDVEQEETRSEGSVKNKICTCNLDDGYVKQLKQLRWGHIRHIQHEARRLADLEEFLDRIGECDP